MSNLLHKSDLKDLAAKIENALNIDMYLNDIFSEDLNLYFNYDYSAEDDFLQLNFEIEEGPASLKILDISFPFTEDLSDYILEGNEVFENYKQRISCQNI